jgi:hypothetical protein
MSYKEDKKIPTAAFMRRSLESIYKTGKKTPLGDIKPGTVVVALNEPDGEDQYLLHVVGYKSDSDEKSVNLGIITDTKVDDNWWGEPDELVVIMVPVVE